MSVVTVKCQDCGENDVQMDTEAQVRYPGIICRLCHLLILPDDVMSDDMKEEAKAWAIHLQEKNKGVKPLSLPSYDSLINKKGS